MKPLRNFLDRIKPAFSKNKFAHTIFDGFETFLYQPNEITKGGVHIKDGMDLKRIMVHVVIALQLCYLHGTLNIGHQHYLSLGLYPGIFDGILYKFLYGAIQMLPIFIVAHVVGLGIEFFFAAKKGHGIEEGFLVSGALIPLIMPPDISLWMLALSTAFAVIIAKEAFGGTGMNILNIALTARVFVFFAYPGDISGDLVWVAYDYNWIHQLVGLESHTLALKGLTELPAEGIQALMADGFSGATPLALAATGGMSAVLAKFSIFDMFFGFIPGSIGEMSKIFIIFGGIFLLVTKIASWRIMFSMLLGCAFMGILLNILHSTAFPDSVFLGVPWYYHMIMGSFLFALVFMATDPVTASSTDTGKLIYGFIIGCLGMIIRVLNPAYPEGWMLAILFMNVFAPLVDYFVLQSNIKRRLSRVS